MSGEHRENFGAPEGARDRIPLGYRALGDWGCRELLDAGLGEAALDARLLLESVTGADRERWFRGDTSEVSPEEAERYRALIARRLTHEPTAYILGEQYFMGLAFHVEPGVLIPRPDTECLVEEAMKDLGSGRRILDLCTGSGCILLSLLHYSADTVGVGTDLSPAALKVARENADALGLAERALFYEGDLEAALPEGIAPFHLIVSNPPYIATDEIGGLMPEVQSHEPYMALDGGEDGLSFYRRIAAAGRELLLPGGELLLEIGYDQGESVPQILEAAGYRDIQVIKDLAGLHRVVRGRRGL